MSLYFKISGSQSGVWGRGAVTFYRLCYSVGIPTDVVKVSEFGGPSTKEQLVNSDLMYSIYLKHYGSKNSNDFHDINLF